MGMLLDQLPSADLEVYFDYNSTSIAPAALPILMTLGKALTDGRIAGNVFVVAGHTDGKGSTEYNLDLSKRRAEAVRTFLIGAFAIEPTKLVAMGFGKERLRHPSEPFAAKNRRVQVVNWGSVARK